jgi:pimeloyl-ACP methyl ester carboxylesterase
MDPETSRARYDTAWIRRGPHRIHARVHHGTGPPIVLMHGFPDSQHLYDRLLPHLPAERAVVAFHFLGWGESVVDQLGLGRVVLVA